MLKKAQLQEVPFYWWIIIAAIPTVVHLVLSWQTISFSSLYLDEAYSVFYCQQPLENFGQILEREVNPPLHFLLLSFWIKLFGDTEMAVRSLSLLFSGATVFTLVLFGRRFFHPLTGIFAAFLFCFSTVHFRIGHEARAYAMFGFLTVLSFWMFLAMLEKPTKKKTIGLTVVNALLLYTHLTGVFVLFAQFLALLLWKNKPAKTNQHYFLSQGIIALLCLPFVFLLTTSKVGATSSWLQAPDWSTFLDLPHHYVYFDWIVYVGLGLVIVAAIIGKKKLDGPYMLLLFWGVLTFFVAFIVSQWFPLFIVKYLLFAATGLLFLFCEATLRLRLPLWLRTIPLVGLVVLFAYNMNAHPKKGEDWRTTVEYVNTIKKQDCGIIVMPGSQYRSWAYYANKNAFRDYDSTIQLLYQEQTYFVNALETPFFEYVDHEQFILVGSNKALGGPFKQAQTLLEKSHQKVGDQKLDGIHIMVYSR